MVNVSLVGCALRTLLLLLKPRTEPAPPVEVFGGLGVILTTRAFEKARKAAPGLDIYALEAEWRDWIRTKPLPNDPEAAFVGFCRKRQKMMGGA